VLSSVFGAVGAFVGAFHFCDFLASFGDFGGDFGDFAFGAISALLVLSAFGAFVLLGASVLWRFSPIGAFGLLALVSYGDLVLLAI
jgi:hypothetical protein